jgi:hypothetical protein
MDISRRSFLKKTSSSLVFGVAAGQSVFRPIAAAAQAVNELSEQRRQGETRSGDMLYRTLGRTKERISVIGLGGYHIGKPQLSEADSTQIIRSAIDRGITLWTIVGTTTMATAKSRWARLFATATVRRYFS